MLDNTLGKKLRGVREELGWSQQEAGKRAGVDPNMIYQYEAGHRNPSTLALRGLASLYGKPVEWFFREEEPQHLPTRPTPGESVSPPAPGPEGTTDPLDQIQAGIARVEAFLHAQALTEGTAESRVGYEPSDTSPVEVLEVASAAGGGADVYDETPVGRLWFRNDWLQSHSIDPKQSHIISVSGESMEPTLPNGCSILVDRRRTEPQEGRIYVMRTEDGLVVKRVGEDEDGYWQMLSDNSTWSPAPLLEETDIIGEVRWAARTF